MTLDRTKLSRILALLASDQAGERDAAVLAAGRLLKAAGVRWEALAPAGEAQDHDALLLAALSSVEFWRNSTESAQRKRDEFQTTLQQRGRETRALRRENADLQARLDIAQAENAKLRAAARAVFEGLAAIEAMEAAE